MLLTNPVISIDGDKATAHVIWTGVMNEGVGKAPSLYEQGREDSELRKVQRQMADLPTLHQLGQWPAGPLRRHLQAAGKLLNRRGRLDARMRDCAFPILRMKFYSWNVNGIRAVVKKGTFQKFMAEHQPDILCLQETKAERGQAEDRPGRLPRVLEFGREEGLFRHRHLLEAGAHRGDQRLSGQLREEVHVCR